MGLEESGVSAEKHVKWARFLVKQAKEHLEQALSWNEMGEFTDMRKAGVWFTRDYLREALQYLRRTMKGARKKGNTRYLKALKRLANKGGERK